MPPVPADGSAAMLNLHLSAVVGSMFSAGSVIDKYTCVSSEGFWFWIDIAVSPAVFPNATLIESEPYSTRLSDENSNAKM